MPNLMKNKSPKCTQQQAKQNSNEMDSHVHTGKIQSKKRADSSTQEECCEITEIMQSTVYLNRLINVSIIVLCWDRVQWNELI